jgi:hypothetical protein
VERVGRPGVMGHALLPRFLFLRQASEQVLTSFQFLAQLLRHVMTRPHTLQGLLGRVLLLPLKLPVLMRCPPGP